MEDYMKDEKIKHLEFIQSIISRMANNSFIIKGWSITVLTAIFLLANIETNINFVFVALIPTIFFFFLDAYFLQLERKYRKLYNLVLIDASIESMSLKILPSSKEDKTTFVHSLFSKTIVIFYLGLILALIVMYIFLASSNNCVGGEI